MRGENFYLDQDLLFEDIQAMADRDITITEDTLVGAGGIIIKLSIGLFRWGVFFIEFKTLHCYNWYENFDILSSPFSYAGNCTPALKNVRLILRRTLGDEPYNFCTKRRRLL